MCVDRAGHLQARGQRGQDSQEASSGVPGPGPQGYLSPVHVLKVPDGCVPQGTENPPEASAASPGPVRVQARELGEGPQAQAAAV